MGNLEKSSQNAVRAEDRFAKTVQGLNLRMGTKYSYRAGTTTEFYWGDEENGDYLWFSGNSQKSTHSVGQKKPNAWGLYDMSGNVSEWCRDWFRNYMPDDQIDPEWSEDRYRYRILRGGSWCMDAQSCRAASRSPRR